MRNNSTHAMFPAATHDEQALQNYIKSLRGYTTARFHGTNRRLVAAIEPGLRRDRKGRTSRKAVREALAPLPGNRWTSAMLRTTQEMLYDTVGPSIERQLPALVAKARALTHTLGSLRLDPAVRMPPYLAAVDFHCKPGSYQQELTDDDVFPGAEYDRTFRLYSMGSLGPDLDAHGHCLIAWIRQRFTDLSPLRILDIGCTIGHATLPYVDGFGMAAEVHAIDVAAPCLRYGHARAAAMGKPVHFSQQNAERTDFPDAHFDLIVSHQVLHETSHAAIRNIFRECRRLLAPGGVMAHLEGMTPDDTYMRYYTEWLAHYNNEPYLGTLQDEDFTAICKQAGFAADRIDIAQIAPIAASAAHSTAMVPQYMIVAARR